MTAKVLLIIALIASFLGNIFGEVGDTTEDSAGCLIVVLAIIAQLIVITASYKILIMVFIALGI